MTRVILVALASFAIGACGVRAGVLSDRVVEAVDAGSDAFEPSDARTEDAAPVGTGAWVATGQMHTCAIRGGVLACWGANGAGRLGLGDEVDRDRPAQVTSGGPWVEVSAGDRHTCARDEAGAIACFGDNDRGQLGLGDLAARRTPERVSLPRPALSVSSGFEVTCAVLDDRSAWCWGENLEGQLGRADTYPGAPSPTPLRVGEESDWTRVAAGQGHVCGIRAPGTLWCWGRNTDGQLAQGDSAPVQLRAPTRVGTSSDWIDVDVGQDTTCGLRADGSMWCWGANNFGQAGAPPSSHLATPLRVGADADWIEVRTDTFATCARKSSGSLWCFGRNVEGQLGLGDTVDRSTPTRVDVATDWVQIDVGRFHACGRKTSGAILCTGENRDGQLGLADRDRRSTFTEAALSPPPT